MDISLYEKLCRKLFVRSYLSELGYEVLIFFWMKMPLYKSCFTLAVFQWAHKASCVKYITEKCWRFLIIILFVTSLHDAIGIKLTGSLSLCALLILQEKNGCKMLISHFIWVLKGGCQWYIHTSSPRQKLYKVLLLVYKWCTHVICFTLSSIFLLGRPDFGIIKRLLDTVKYGYIHLFWWRE